MMVGWPVKHGLVVQLNGVGFLRQTVRGEFFSRLGVRTEEISGNPNKSAGILLTSSDRFFARIKNPKPPTKS